MLVVEERQIQFFSKPGCHLCEEVDAVLARLAGEFRLRIERRNIMEDIADYEAFKNDVPVLFLDGRRLEREELQPDALLSRIKG